MCISLFVNKVKCKTSINSIKGTAMSYLYDIPWLEILLHWLYEIQSFLPQMKGRLCCKILFLTNNMAVLKLDAN